MSPMSVRTAFRWLGTALIASGVLVLAWVVLVWQWQDPFTALYTKWEQRELRSEYAPARVRVPAAAGGRGTGRRATWPRTSSRSPQRRAATGTRCTRATRSGGSRCRGSG